METNFLAVILAAISAMVVGFVWYGPLFGKLWINLSGFKEEDMQKAQEQGMTKYYAVAFVGALVTAFVLSLIINVTNVSSTIFSVTLALWIWLGFVVTTLLSSVLWEGKPFKLFLLNISQQLVTLVVMAIILSLWK
jgi:hypothetical protein